MSFLQQSFDDKKDVRNKQQIKIRFIKILTHFSGNFDDDVFFRAPKSHVNKLLELNSI